MGRTVVLYIAMSLDGYIADRAGGVDWLAGHGETPEDDGYDHFIQGVDTVVMGGRTYRQVATELSPEAWPYEGLTTYVVTRGGGQSPRPDVVFTGQAPEDLVRALRDTPGREIWICGGAEIARRLMAADLIDRWQLSLIPTLLGGGVRLFGPLERERRLRLTGSAVRGGIAELTYERRG